MKILHHILKQPFIAATGGAALVHSTWALGTLFAGQQPEGWHLLGWLLPALLISFALDVGQIATSAEIQAHGLTWRRGVTFIVFSCATYYLQWLYIAHHMPQLELAPGVRGAWVDFATLFRDAAVWFIPALLPLSTLLYTFSGDKKVDQHMTMPAAPVVAVVPDLPQTTTEDAPQLSDGLRAAYPVQCDACGAWSKTYDNPQSAARGLATHMSKHCTALHPVLSANGHGGQTE